MIDFQFDDTQTSGIWWSTNVGIRDLCVELKSETRCSDNDIVSLLRTIADSINTEGL
tara:strand:- start:1931 stop:2101 length:171 start_codon:yes stop_codon:yes gene_type:complete